MKVHELARAAAVAPHTVRYYARLGLLSPGRNPDNRYRRFAVEDGKRLRFIRTAQSLGFKLSEVKEILADSDMGRSPCARVRLIMELRIAETRERLRNLGVLLERMETSYVAWESMPDGGGEGAEICPLIEAMGGLGRRHGETGQEPGV